MTDTVFLQSDLIEAVTKSFGDLRAEMYERLHALMTVEEFAAQGEEIRKELADQLLKMSDDTPKLVDTAMAAAIESQAKALADITMQAQQLLIETGERMFMLERRMHEQLNRISEIKEPAAGKDGEQGEPGPPGKDGKGEKGDRGADGLSFMPMGKYDEAKAYHFRDVVAWNGGSWCAMRQTAPGEEPGIEADERNPAWTGFSQRGRPGKPGERGLTGKDGKLGERGPVGVGERGERGASIAAIAFDGWRLRIVDSDGVELDPAPFDAMRSLLDDLMSRIDAIETKDRQ